ncbi:MAG TPA: LacI family DNA-binding transcriptional regulator [Aliidongia sp.]|nr:LacI family DNA-binding transcriptional regulator [Aliidongia sp.]
MSQRVPTVISTLQPQSVTIQEVADLARVSPKTVSRVINNEPGVRADTHLRVLQAIEQLDYRPNLNARSLASDRSFLIGLFCHRPGDYLSDFQTGAVERCRVSGFHLMVEPWDGTGPEMANQVATLLRQLRLEGVILLPPLSDHPLILSKLEDAAVPIVRIAPRRVEGASPCVRIDDYRAARALTAHLLDLGHRRIGFLRGHPEHGATEQRYGGFADEMAARGVPVEPGLVLTGNFTFADGFACAETLLGDADPPTAIFASNDDMAAAAVSVAQRRGLKLPEQLSVVGFDDSPVAQMIWPQLTTIRQPVKAMAAIATDLIIRHSPRRRGWPEPIPHQMLDFEFVSRNSTAPCAGASG